MKSLRPRLLLVSGVAVAALVVACDDDASATHGSSSSVASTTSSTGGGGTGGGAGGTGGIGEPSDVYPAPHGDVPQAIDSGGPRLAAPTMIPIVFQGDDPTRVALIEDLAAKVGPSEYWSATTQEYGVGPLAIHATVTLAEHPAAKLSPLQIEAWLRDKLNTDDPGLPAPVDGAIYAIFYPAGVSVEDPGGASCTAFAGYHSSVTLDAAHGSKSVAYAVIPRCAEFFGRSEIDTLTSTTTHELIEAATDPFPLMKPAYQTIDEAHAYWTFVFGGGELSDMCNLPLDSNIVLPGTSYRVQRSWSNASALAGHDPCVPALPGKVYFNASPDLPDDITVASGVVSKGVQIPADGTRTIGLRLFSEAATAPIKVVPEDWSEITGGTKQLELTLDEGQGLNGQTLHLTIKVLGKKKTQLFRISSTDGTQWTGWIGVVGR
ncbi:MAG: hypothetical protein U0414_05035 [Polyangiaceae bacterium]